MNAGAKSLLCAAALFAALAPLTTSAQSPEGSFLTDYSKLQPAKDNPFDEIYLSPKVLQHSTQYTAVMIDQPELFIHPDSKYKGMKPDDMKVIGDGLREKVMNELKGGYQVVDKPGPNVLYLRLAVGDLMLQKKKRPILAYTPVGALVYGAKKLASEVTSNVNLTNMKVEGEVIDSVTNEQFGAFTSSRGSLSVAAGDAQKPISWDELENLFGIVGKRVRCRLDNLRLPESEWQKCGEIGLSTTTPAKAGSR